jgi:ferredoxin-NADP reductase/ferredoxin
LNIMTTHAISLATRDGRTFQFSAGEEQDLLGAAADAGMLLPSLCRDGGCGACTCTVAEGDFRLGDYNPAALPAAARERGEVLLCRTYAEGDLSLRAPYGSEQVRFENAASRPADIAELDTVAENTVRLLLRLCPDPEGGTALEFEPGQYVTLGIPGTGVERPYSLANTPNWSGELEFFIHLQTGGRFSDFLRTAPVGGRLDVAGPAGHFILQAQSLKPRWFVGGGTGLAPLLCMLRHMAEFGETQPARLFFGVTRESELFAREELARLQQDLPQLRATLCVWRPEPGWSGFHGTAADALREELAAAGTRPDIYLCGPPGLVDAVTSVAREAGLADEDIFSERFLAVG